MGLGGRRSEVSTAWLGETVIGTESAAVDSGDESDGDDDDMTSDREKREE